MIQVTRLNHIPLIINSDLIEHIEANPDTVVSMTTGQTFMVLETPGEIVERIMAFRRSLLHDQPSTVPRLEDAVPESDRKMESHSYGR